MIYTHSAKKDDPAGATQTRETTPQGLGTKMKLCKLFAGSPLKSRNATDCVAEFAFVNLRGKMHFAFFSRVPRTAETCSICRRKYNKSRTRDKNRADCTHSPKKNRRKSALQDQPHLENNKQEKIGA